MSKFEDTHRFYFRGLTVWEIAERTGQTVDKVRDTLRPSHKHKEPKPKIFPHDLVTYFIQAENGLIKIGETTRFEKRFLEISFMSPLPLTVIGFTKESEKKIHKAFNHLRLHGEWFEPGEDLLAYIQENTSAALPTYTNATMPKDR